MVKITTTSSGPKQVPFSEIKEGGWFFYKDQLGVKVDGNGFYPNWFGSGINRGIGGSGRLVIPVSDVEIKANL